MKPYKADTDLSTKPPEGLTGEPQPEVALAPVARRGTTTVADSVISTIARLAAEQTEGVHHVGNAGLRGALGWFSSNGGVSAEVGATEAAVSLDIVIHYGYRIREVATRLRKRVLESVDLMASRKIVAVDINVVGVHIDKVEPATARSLA